jgi:hypothetical protein
MPMVLVFGLMSCAKKEQAVKKDSYRAPAPRINKGGQSIDLKGWDRTNQRTLDIQDSLDVRNSGATKVTITSRCRRGELDFTYTLTTPETEPIGLYKTLDRNLLSEDLNALPATCTFEIALTNGNGSRHIYSVPQSTLRDEQPSPVVFERDGNKLDQQRNRFVVGKLNGVIYRFSNSGSHSRLLCQDAQDAIRGFAEVGRLEEHGFNSMIVKTGRSPEALQTKSIQLCRILITLNGADQAFSPLFEVQFARAALVLRAQAQFNRKGDMNYPEKLADPAAAALVEGRPWEAAQYVIENRMNIERLVRLPKEPLNVDISIVMMGAPPFPVHKITRKFLFAEPNGPAIDKGDHYLLRVPPNGSFQLSLIVRPPRPLGCGPSTVVERRMAIDFVGLNLLEVNENGEGLWAFTDNLGPRAYIGSSNGEFDQVAPQAVGKICHW